MIPEPIPKTKITYLTKFSLVTLFLAVIIGVSLSWVIERNLLNIALQSEAEATAKQFANYFRALLSNIDLDVPFNPELYSQIDDLTHEFVLNERIVRVKIWNRNGIILYSDNQDLIGKSFSISEDLEQALAGTVAMEITPLKEDEHIAEKEQFSQLMEIYVPIFTRNTSEVSGAFEIYSTMEDIQIQRNLMRTSIWTTVSIAILIFYGALFFVVKNTSRQLIDSNIEISKLNKETRQQLDDLKLAETATRVSEERFRGLAQTATDAIITISSDGAVTFFNKAAEQIFGYLSTEVVSQNVDILMPEEFKEQHSNGIIRFLDTRKPSILGTTVELQGRRKKGGIFPIELSLSEVQIDEKTSFTAIIRDITQRVLVQEQITKQIDRISALQKIDQAILGSVDLEVTLEVILDQVRNQLGVDAAAISLLNQLTLQLEYSSGIGFLTSVLEHPNLKLGEGHAGRAALERQMIYIENLYEDGGDQVRAPRLIDEGFMSYFVIPLITKGQIKGVLEVFHRKLFEYDQEWVIYLESLASQIAIAVENSALFTSLERSNFDLILAYDATIKGWANALELKDLETKGHSQRVLDLTLRLARQMGIRDQDIVHIQRGALLHDIGKMGVPDSILQKPGKLTKEEWQIMKEHPGYAFNWLSSIDFLRPAMEIPYSHHEKWDGSGYPRGLQGEQIPLSARIFSVVDVWDALTSDRPYRKAWSKEKAVDHIQKQSGEHFDPRVVEVFLKSNPLAE